MAMLQQTIFDCAIYHGYGNRIAQRDHKAGGFALELGLKDVSLILDTAHKANAPMPFGSVLRDRFLAAKAGGHADLDWSALGLRASLESGKLAEVEAAVEKARSA
jgi:3-hydroxyisobutyrate dehydrogenase-like beta-hydroxyacid dehydrogenase